MSAPVDVSVLVPSQPGSCAGRVVDVRHAVDGVRVELEFPSDGAPLLPVGRAGGIQFSRSADPVSGTTSASITALGKVAQRSDRAGVRAYECLFGDRTRQGLAHLLEPRRSFRVYRGDSDPVLVTVKAAGVQGGIIGPARDVSISGVGLEIPWEHELNLCDTAEVAIRVRLPAASEELEFQAQIVNRSLGEGSIVYGFCFSDVTSADDARVARVAAYVRSRGGTPALGA